MIHTATPGGTEMTSTPREIDAALAALYNEMNRVQQRLDTSEYSALIEAGAKFYYVGRRRVTDMKLADAEQILAADIAAHADDDKYGYSLVRGGTSIGNIRRTVEALAEYRATLAGLRAQMEELEQRYTGWSRFFLVTSSKGHIHSSMHCSTCRLTTTYGWLPELSGRTEADCVAEFGPALCSVCFPSAPVEWTQAEVTKAAATKAAA